MHTSIHHFFELLWSMTQKELTARYKNTLFGFLWMVINPLIQMIVIGFIFTLFFKNPIEHYQYYLFVGLLVWNFFSVSINKVAPSIVNERALIKKSAFPRWVIPLSIIFSNLINFGAAFALFTIGMLFVHPLFAQDIFFFVAGMTLLTLLTAGLGLLTSALNVRYRDVTFFIQALLTIWFYATPVAYSLSQIPESYLPLWQYNPLTIVVELIQSAYLHTPPPAPFIATTNIVIITIILISGIVVFQKENKLFDDWL